MSPSTYNVVLFTEPVFRLKLKISHRMSGTYPNPANSIYSSTYGEVRNYSQAPTYTAYNAPNPYQSVAYPTQPASYSTQPASHPTNPTSYSTQTQAYQIYSDATATSSPSYGETLAGYKPITGEALDLPGQSGSTAKRGGFSSRAPFPSFRQRRFLEKNLCFSNWITFEIM